MRILLACLLAVCLAAGPMPAAAKSLSEAEQAALSETVDDFSKAMKGNDFKRVIATLPPRLIEKMSAQVGVPADQLRDMLAAQSAQVMGNATVEKFATDLSDLSAKSGKMPDGSKVLYAFVPAEVVFTMGGKTHEAPQNLLALKDGEAWYLMRVQSDGHVKMLQDIYPFLKRRDFKF